MTAGLPPVLFANHSGDYSCKDAGGLLFQHLTAVFFLKKNRPMRTS